MLSGTARRATAGVPTGVVSLVSTLTTTDHAVWAERLMAVRDKLTKVIEAANARGQLQQALKALAVGLVHCLASKEGQVVLATCAALEALAEAYSARLAPHAQLLCLRSLSWRPTSSFAPGC